MSRLLVLIGFFGLAIAQTVNNNADSFDVVDSNADGKVSEAELNAFMRKNNRRDAGAVFAKFDLDRSGDLDISEFVPLVFEVNRQPVDLTYQFFKKMDRNDDGIVDVNEVAALRRESDDRIIDGLLDISDANHDGQLSFEEFTANLTGQKQTSKAEEERQTALQLLSFMDTNGDNKLDENELFRFTQKTSTNKIKRAEVKQVLALLDTNHDGFLSHSELVALAQRFSTLSNLPHSPPKV